MDDLKLSHAHGACASGRSERFACCSAQEAGMVLVGLAACWVGAGSTGLVAWSFRHGLLAFLLGALAILAWPARWVCFPFCGSTAGLSGGVPLRGGRIVQAAGLLLLVILFGADSHPVLNLLAVVVLGAGFACVHQGRRRSLLTSLVLAGLALAVHRLAMLTVPTYWSLTNWVGGVLGWLGGTLGGHPLEVGATFAGLDFLILTKAWCLAWWGQTNRQRWGWPLALAMVVLLGHLLYLVVLSWAPILKEHLPPPPPRPEYHVYLPPAWSWSEAFQSFLPWGLPWLGMGIHLGILAVALRWIGWPDSVSPSEEPSPVEPETLSRKTSRSFSLARNPPGSPVGKMILVEAGPVVLALMWGFISFMWFSPSTLSGKKILAYAPHPLDWSRPAPDRYARSDAGRFGMLAELVASLGGQWTFSHQLTEQQLQQTDLLLLVGDPGSMPSEAAERLENYLRSGGAILAAPTGRLSASSDQQGTVLADLLVQWGIRVREETAVPAWGEWWEALAPVSHPAAFGMADKATINRGAVAGLSRSATLELRWPASAVLVGLWGYGDPGTEAARTEFLPQYEPGERLGDLILAAETRLGSGRLFVLAGADCLRNENLPSSYLLVARLFGYLVHRGPTPSEGWRQMLALLVGVVLLGLLAHRPQPGVVAVVAATLGLVMLAGWWTTAQAGRVLPNPLNPGQPSSAVADATSHLASSTAESSSAELLGPRGLPLAYIDASHMEAYSLAPWSPDGLGRLFVSLMQAGYLPLLAPDGKPDRLQTAAVWLSIAPARKFSAAEQAALKEYVQNGGIFIAMAGAEDAEAIRPLLATWQLRIPRSPLGAGETEPEAEPIGQSPSPGQSPDLYGRLRTYYLNAQDYGRGDYMVAVTFYAPWPVETDANDAEVLVRGYEDVPIVLHRRIGGGSVVVIGDTYFATNKNFDQVDDSPTAGLIENAHFWRWMLSRLSRQEEWVPPNPQQWQDQLPPDQLFPEEAAPEEPSRRLPRLRRQPEPSL